MPRAARRARVRRPELEVLAPVTRRGVDEAGSGVFGDVVAGEERNVKAYRRANPCSGCRRSQHSGWIAFNRAEAFKCVDLGVPEKRSRRPTVGENIPSRRPPPNCPRRRSHPVAAVGDASGNSDRAIAGDRPRRRSPDDDRGRATLFIKLAKLVPKDLVRIDRGVFSGDHLQGTPRKSCRLSCSSYSTSASASAVFSTTLHITGLEPR